MPLIYIYDGQAGRARHAYLPHLNEQQKLENASAALNDDLWVFKLCDVRNR